MTEQTPARHHARAAALQFLYQLEARQEMVGSSPTDLENHFSHFEVHERYQEFAKTLAAGVLEFLQSIDEQIQNAGASWSVPRMSVIDRNILRLGIYEMTHLSDIDFQVSINEAVELAKEFGTADSPSFINGVLDAVAKKR